MAMKPKGWSSRKAAIKLHWQREGKWPRFIEVREALKRTGTDEVTAWQQAHEAMLKDGKEDWGQEEPAVTEGLVEEIADVREGAPAKVADGGGSGGAGRLGEVEGLVRDVVAAAKGLPGKKKGRKATEREIIRWVFDHMDVAPEDIVASTVPGPGALSLLATVRANHMNRWEFFKNLWAKVIPPQKEGADGERLDDDGRTAESLIDSFLKGLNDESES